VPTPRTYPSERERERPSAPAARPAAAPRASSLSSRIAGVPSNGGGKGAAGGGLFERLGLATNRPPAPRGPPPARRAGPTAAAGFGEGGGDLMDMFGDSCVPAASSELAWHADVARLTLSLAVPSARAGRCGPSRWLSRPAAGPVAGAAAVVDGPAKEAASRQGSVASAGWTSTEAGLPDGDEVERVSIDDSPPPTREASAGGRMTAQQQARR